MPTADNALLQYESGQSAVAMTALTDQGDHIDYRSAATLWSNKSGYSPDVRPNGVANGLVVTPATAAGDDDVDVSAGYCYLAGVYTSVSASADEQCTRATPTDTHIINSIQVTSAGAISVVVGTDGTSFSETRGGTGGPPFILVDSIEIAQVRFDSNTAAPVESDEIFDTPGTHREIWNFPNFTTDYYKVENGALGYAGVNMVSALPLSHTGGVTKKVYASYYTPSFTEAPDAYDFKAPVNTHSTSSQQVYGRTVGSSASTLNQGSFSILLTDGISDGILTEIDQELFFRFYQDRLKSPYIICQGKLAIDADFPADSNLSAACTISSTVKAERVTG